MQLCYNSGFFPLLLLFHSLSLAKKVNGEKGQVPRNERNERERGKEDGRKMKLNEMKINYIKVTTNCLRMNKSHSNNNNNDGRGNMECHSTKATTVRSNESQRGREKEWGRERSLSELALCCVLLSCSLAIAPSCSPIGFHNTIPVRFNDSTSRSLSLALSAPSHPTPPLFGARVCPKLGQPLNPLR